MPTPTTQEQLDAAIQARHEIVSGKIKDYQSAHGQRYTMQSLSELSSLIDRLQAQVAEEASPGGFHRVGFGRAS